jgi:hypothetical protein
MHNLCTEQPRNAGNIPNIVLWNTTGNIRTVINRQAFPRSRRCDMASYDVVLADGAVERIEGADTYEQEGPLTTFFETADDRRVIDCWSVRLTSLRTADIVRIRRRVAPVSELRAAV